MAPRTAGDRIALESALNEEELQALDAVCAALDVPRDRWHRVAGIAELFEVIAVCNETDRIHNLRHLNIGQSRATACMNLGLGSKSAETIRKREQRWRNSVLAQQSIPPPEPLQTEGQIVPRAA